MSDAGSASSGGHPVGPARSRREQTVDLWLAHKPGEVIADRYLLVKKLDQGGMGVVWVAHHLGLDIHVALKLLHPSSDMAEAAERLVREAKAAARVDHPAIVHVLDVGWTADHDPFLVMELLEGEPLGDVLARERRLDAVTAMQILLPIAGALAAMHAKGILHRDVKPDNIFLAQDDAGRWQPKLIDFGLARLEAKPLSPITQRGMVVGTPVYLAPERIWGEEADPRDDVWSLCVALYEMVTGVVPFEGEHPAQILLAVKAGEPAPFASHGIEDPALWEIVRRGLMRRRARWASVRELGEALARLLWERGVGQDISGISLWPSWLDGPEHRPRTGAPPAPPSTEPPPGRSRRAVSLGEPRLPAETQPPPEPTTRERARFQRPASLPALPRTTASLGLLPPTTSTPSPTLPTAPPTATTAAERPRPSVAWLAAGAIALAALAATFLLLRRGDPPRVEVAAPRVSAPTEPPPASPEAAPPTATATASAQIPEKRPSPPVLRERPVVPAAPAVPAPAAPTPPAPTPSSTAAQDLKDPFR